MNLESKTIRLRLVDESDAKFILKLRMDSKYNQFLSSVSADLQSQKDWISKYKKDEEDGTQFYFIIERLDGTPCGTIRVYDLREDSFCWGSWILNEEKTRYAAIESAFLIYLFGFEKLGFSKSHFDVMKGNERVISFHKKMGATQVGEDNDNFYFEITKEAVIEAQAKIDRNEKLTLKDSYPISEIHIGMSSSYTRTVTNEDIQKFAEVTGDNNPVHLDHEYAKSTRFKSRIAHGLLTASFFSAIFGTKFPGKGSIYISQNLEFKRPVYLDDTVTATVVVKTVDIVKKRVVFETICTVDGNIVTSGFAELFVS
jgi:acyl dehydratase/RimJ/RimL family protein N-acetyltransferase